MLVAPTTMQGSLFVMFFFSLRNILFEILIPPIKINEIAASMMMTERGNGLKILLARKNRIKKVSAAITCA